MQDDKSRLKRLYEDICDVVAIIPATEEKIMQIMSGPAFSDLTVGSNDDILFVYWVFWGFRDGKLRWAAPHIALILASMAPDAVMTQGDVKVSASI